MGGAYNYAQGAYSACFGGAGNNTIGNSAACLGGEGVAATGDYSACIGGQRTQAEASYAVCYGLDSVGAFPFGCSHASGWIYAAGDSQYSNGLVLTGVTAGATVTESVTLTTLEGSGSSLDLALCNSPTSYTLKVLADASTPGQWASWEFLVHCTYNGTVSTIDYPTSGLLPSASSAGDAATWTLTPSVTGTIVILTFTDGTTTTAKVRCTAHLEWVQGTNNVPS